MTQLEIHAPQVREYEVQVQSEPDQTSLGVGSEGIAGEPLLMMVFGGERPGQQHLKLVFA
jgi:hypothetical protein